MFFFFSSVRATKIRYLDDPSNTPAPPAPPATSTPPTTAPAPTYPVDPSAVQNTYPVDNFNNYPLYSDFTLVDLVQMFVVYAFIIAAALSAVFVFMGGMSFILSGGNDEKIKQAINTIRYSVIGLIVTILSFTFVAIVGRIFGMNFLSYLSYQDIKYSIHRLLNNDAAPVDGFEIRR